MAILLLTDLRGGVNEDQPATIPDNQVAEAVNVTYWKSFLAGRRNGSSIIASGLNVPYYALATYSPDNASANDQLWGLTKSNTNASYAKWTANALASPPTLITPVLNDGFIQQPADTANLHGKLFIAAQSKVVASGAVIARMHVWDFARGLLRRVGQAAPPAAPAVANTGSGTFSGTRYYRVRFLQGGIPQTLISEPSSATAFTPSGTGAGALITIPPLVNEGENYWTIEVSTDNANFYEIATQGIATTTYTDTLAATAISSNGVLSAPIGLLVPPVSAKLLTTDRDHLIVGGNYEDPQLDADVSWTAIGRDPGAGAQFTFTDTGFGNDERIPANTANTVRLNGLNDGGLTGMKSFNQSIVTFKRKSIYVLDYTGSLNALYVPSLLSSTFGALAGSVVDGIDAKGNQALYFVDSKLGPMRLSIGGFEVLAPQYQRAFVTNTYVDGSLSWPGQVSAVFHRAKQEVWWHLPQQPLVGGTAPFARWVYNTKTSALTIHTLPDAVAVGVPFVNSAALWNGVPYTSQLRRPAADGILVAWDQAGVTTDYGNAFRAYVTTRAYQPGQLVDRAAVKGVVLDADAASGVSVQVTIIRDYGAESLSRTASLTPAPGQAFVSVSLDDAFMSEATTLQFQLGDASGVAVTPWSLQRLAARLEKNGSNV